MFSSTILDVAVGLIFAFLAVSLVASAATEALASILNWRGKTLLDGVQSLLNDKDLSGFAHEIYNHALTNPTSDGTTAAKASPRVMPSYIDPKLFAGALIDVIEKSAGAGATIEQGIAAIPDLQLRAALQGMYDRVGGDADRFHKAIEGWFDSSMDRVSGTYKRYTQLVAFVIGLLAAAVLNIDAVHVAKALWQQPMVAGTFHVAPPDSATILEQLNNFGLPIGWGKVDLTVGNLLIILTGWLITAVATLFGAPFWFGALQGIGQLRSSGPRPADKPPAPQ
jgi:hypothetical protein